MPPNLPAHLFIAATATVSLSTAALVWTATGTAAAATLAAVIRHAGPEQIVKAYIDAMNAGTAEALRHFEETHRAPEALALRPADERVAQGRRIRADLGALTLREIVSSTSDAATAIISTEKAGDLECTFEFKEGKLMVIRIEPAGAGSQLSDQASIQQTVTTLAAALEEGYVFPEVGRKMSEHLKATLERGGYDDLGTQRDLAERLTKDLQAISNDKHLRIRPAPSRPVSAALAGGGGGPVNAGFRKVEILEGNVGYLRLDGFADGEDARRIASGAMNFLANCDAVIFDMRFNGGGSPEMIRFITSYIFDKPTHLNSFYDRLGNKTEEYWTFEEVPGKRLKSDAKIIVLTSGYTFSGAEEFSYNLQALKRATIIGERTGGGAHPVRMAPLPGGLAVSVPFARAENPITKTNWEGTGVQPDIEVPANEALDHAIDQLLISDAGVVRAVVV